MASEDVIELGSSDEDPEPAPKKKKPMPNAMVHIPNKLPGVTIKPTTKATSKLNPLTIAKGTIGKSVTVTKLPKVTPPKVIGFNQKINGSTIIKKNPIIRPGKFLPGPDIYNKTMYVPKITTITYNHKIALPTGPTKPAPPKLPPGITVKRAPPPYAAQKVQNKKIQCIKMSKLKSLKIPAENQGDMPTVELDDDETPVAGPQWYMRPEDQTDEKELKTDATMEDQNNKEPDKSSYIEITIEDSPIKHLNKDTEIEVPILIEDSPAKHSGPSQLVKKSLKKKERHSKKRIDYTNEATPHSIEIEIDPIPILINDNEKTKETETSNNNEKQLEIESSNKDQDQASSSKNNSPKVQINTNHSGEFHPVYQQFIDLCFKLENSDDMTKIVEKKIKAYYRQVPKDYTESEIFIDMVISKIEAMKAGPEKMYLYIKDVVDELNLQRKMAKTKPVESDSSKKEEQQFLYGEESEFDSRRKRQIRKLEKTMKKLHRSIQKLEEQEVDFDDDDDSVYLLTERYKERMVRVHAKFCQLTNTKMPSEPRVVLDPRPGRPKGPAKRLEKWINRKVPIGTPLPFPDFHDVLRCVREANTDDKLGWNEADIIEEARDLFTRCGKKLQRRRQENEWRLAASRITSNVDPAEESDELKKKLEDNRRLASVKETEVFNKYADRQNLLKLEAVEIGDKEAEESPVESDDDDVVEEVSLENKEKRKERIKRLLKEKSKKVSEDKTNKETEKSNVSDSVTEHNNETVEVTGDKETDEGKNSDTNTNKVEPVNKDIDPLTSNSPKPLVEDPKTLSPKANKISENRTSIQTLSDDSDIDEMHLLQKLHSDEVNSSQDSDSDEAISVDTLSSGDNKVTSDVISIEDSSYSETERDNNIEAIENERDDIIEENESKSPINEDSAAGTSHTEKDSIETEMNKSTNEECKESEDILLASSDDESEQLGDNNSVESENTKQLMDVNDGENSNLSENNIDTVEINDSQDSVDKIPNDEADITTPNDLENGKEVEVNKDTENQMLGKFDLNTRDTESITEIVKTTNQTSKSPKSDTNDTQTDSNKIVNIERTEVATNNNEIIKITDIHTIDDNSTEANSLEKAEDAVHNDINMEVSSETVHNIKNMEGTEVTTDTNNEMIKISDIHTIEENSTETNTLEKPENAVQSDVCKKVSTETVHNIKNMEETEVTTDTINEMIKISDIHTIEENSTKANSLEKADAVQNNIITKVSLETLPNKKNMEGIEVTSDTNHEMIKITDVHTIEDNSTDASTLEKANDVVQSDVCKKVITETVEPMDVDL